MKNNIPLSEYPRPQFVRDSYISLNGLYDYKISKSKDIPSEYDGVILVPFSPESNASGVNRKLKVDEYLFYRREIDLSKYSDKDYAILHFTAVDQEADIYINNKYVLHHLGGFTPFEIRIPFEEIRYRFNLVIRCRDYIDTEDFSRGKQVSKRGGIWYSNQSGVYLPIWLELVKYGYIESVKYTPDLDKKELTINVKSSLKDVDVTILDKTYNLKTNIDNVIKFKDVVPWEIDDPYLYNVILKNEVDEVKSYFAFRKISKELDKDGHYRFYLNNKPIFIKGLLDQGYYFDTMLTPRSDEDYIKDIGLAKKMGFNTLRKHIKLESLRFYYHCDRLGMLVIQDFINGGSKYNLFTISLPLITNLHMKDDKYYMFARTSKLGRDEFEHEANTIVNYLYNSPCVIMYTIFNEGWGQFDSKRIYNDLTKIDNTRLYDHASGWHDQGISDVKSMHVYFKRVKMPREKNIKNRIVFLSECGGYSLKINNHTFSNKFFGYKKIKSSDHFVSEYNKFMKLDILNNIPKGLGGFIFTQLSDVEDELNGFITYDREVTKVDVNKIKEINDKARL